MSNIVDMIRVENTFHILYEGTSCLDSTYRVMKPLQQYFQMVLFVQMKASEQQQQQPVMRKFR